MEQINQEAFGAFVAALRKEKGLTQKQLAEQLFLSDKAVSKWERGLSLPDVAVLPGLSGVLGVTVTELLAGRGWGMRCSTSAAWNSWSAGRSAFPAKRASSARPPAADGARG